MATSDIPIEVRTASDDELRSMTFFSSDAIKRRVKQQQDIERFDYDFLAGLPSKPKQNISAEEWRREAQEGRIVDLQTTLEPGDMSRFFDPSSTPKQVNLDTILKEIRSIRDDLVTVNERLDKIEKQQRTQYRDTDDTDMFGASAKPKSNPAPRIKTSPNFEENADIYDDQMFGFGRYVPQHYQGPQTDNTSDHTQYPLTNRAERNTFPYRTQTIRRGNHQGPDETRRSVADRLQGVVRQLQQLAVTNKVTPTSDACYTCGGCVHRSRDCANKRRRSPSPLTCFKYNGKGHIARECSNILPRRKETVRTRLKHQYRSSRSSSNNSSADSDSGEVSEQG